MNIDWKKVAYWGAGSIGVGAVLYWLYQYQQSAAANNAASQAAQSQDENQALAALLEQPLSSGSSSDSGASVSGPTVDTGNATLQSLIQSILNPPSTVAPSNPVSTAPSLPANATPGIGTGTLPTSTPNPPPVVSTLPGRVVANPVISQGHLLTLESASSLPQ